MIIFILKNRDIFGYLFVKKIRFFLEERDGNMWLKGILDVILNLKCIDIFLKIKK